MSTLLRGLEMNKLASIKWDDSVIFTLPQLLQVYPLPQIVKINKGLWSESNDATLCNDAILCLHSNIPIQKVHGHLMSDKGKEISIPLDCRRKVEVRPPNLKDVYENVKELFSVFPKYVRISKGYFCESSGEILLNFGDKLQLKGIDKTNKKNEKLVCFTQYGRKIELTKDCVAGFQPLVDGRELYITDALREFKLPLNIQFVEPDDSHENARSDNSSPREAFQTICLDRISNETVLTATSIHADGIHDAMISPNLQLSLVICDETFKNSADYESILKMFNLPDTFPSAPQQPNAADSSLFYLPSEHIYEEFTCYQRHGDLNDGYEIPNMDPLTIDDPGYQPKVGVNSRSTAIPLPKIPVQKDTTIRTPVDNIYVPVPTALSGLESQHTDEDSTYTALDFTKKDNSAEVTYERLVPANPGNQSSEDQPMAPVNPRVPKNAVKLPSLLESKDALLRRSSKNGTYSAVPRETNQDSTFTLTEDIYQELAKYPLDLSDLGVAGVGRLLRNLGMEMYVERFKAEMIDGKILAELDKENLQSLDVSTFHITKLLKFIGGWRPNKEKDSTC
ncbi:uncharacterized protein LOC114535092 [Dendronephthya gigantea]|uniref:uncharacterized protein LOC114535092 n=1 Tax=Dendronephthya gigantea TaxID=151771 RepID=UPI001069BF8B|nr:uncharacterized protein LOC114535092 [Dendronephthya gigantea]